MALSELTLFGEDDKIQKAIETLRSFEPEEGYRVAFSGGKDSQCIYHLCVLAGVKFEAVYNVTSVDPPELIRFIKKQYPDVKFEYPRDKDGKVVTMWNLIPKHTIPPTRMARYCCAELKENSGVGRLVVTGVRWAESPRRKKLHGVVDVRTKSKKIINDALENSESAKLNDRGSLIMNDDNDENRRIVEHCYRTKKTMLNPIVDWTDKDVWNFLNNVVKVPHCELYDQGYRRLGCIGCPMGGSEQMKRDFERYPKYKDAYIRAFDRMVANHKDSIKILSNDENLSGGGTTRKQYSDGGIGYLDWQSDSVLVDETESMRGQDEPVNFAGGGTQSTEFSNGGTGYLESREPNGRGEMDALVDIHEGVKSVGGNPRMVHLDAPQRQNAEESVAQLIMKWWFYVTRPNTSEEKNPTK